MNDRRLPVYLLIDVSGSMDGEPIQAVNNGIQQLVAELRQDRRAVETVWISVITFGRMAQQVIPLTDLESFQAPKLTAYGMTALGPALSLLCECRDREVRNEDYRPLVFCLTDGQQNVGDFEKGISDFKNRKWGLCIFCAAGPDAGVADLERIDPDAVITAADTQPESLAQYFARINQTIACGFYDDDRPDYAIS